MKAIIVTSGTLTGGVYSLDKTLFIGRDPDCDIQLVDPAASRHHAKVEDQPGDKVLLTDLDSQNGTLVEEESVKEKLLEPGDSFEIGHVMFDYLELDQSQVESSHHRTINLLSGADAEAKWKESLSERDREALVEAAGAVTVPPPKK